MTGASHAIRPPRRRAGLTFVELMIAMAITGVLLFGMWSAVAIAMKSTEVGDTGVHAKTTDAARLLERIASELRLATGVDEPLAPDAIVFSVPDMDEDGEQEKIAYAWSGAPDYTVTRTLALSADLTDPGAVVVATDVHQFDLAYLTRTWGNPPPPDLLDSGETLLLSHDDAPSFGTRLLFVVTNQGGPTAQELARESLFEWWGFTVTRITASESPANYDLALASADVVYVSEEINSSDVGTNLTDATIGVINEEINLVDELGLAASFTFPPPDDALDVISDAHYITATLGVGTVSPFTATQAVTALSELPSEQATDLQVLGQWGAAPSLAVVEAGGELLVGTGPSGTLGFDTVYAQETGFDFDGQQVATQVTLAVPAVVTSISAYLEMDRDKDIRFGIYTDLAGEPDTLIVETEKIRSGPGTAWYTLDLPTTPRTVLAPGTYWLAVSPTNEGAYFYEVGGATRHSDYDPKDGFAPTWTDTIASEDRKISVYASYAETGFAAGRRVELPWGGNAFDWNTLTDDGKTIVRRSLEWSADASPGDTSTAFAVGKHVWPAQYVLPALPLNAVHWSLSRILVAIRADPLDPGGKVRFRLHYADAQGKPASLIAETAEIPVTTWDAYEYTWYEIPFDPISDLSPGNGLCLVIKGREDENAFVKIDRGGAAPTPDTHFLETDDDGDTWSTPNETDDMRIYVYGSYATAGEPQWP